MAQELQRSLQTAHLLLEKPESACLQHHGDGRSEAVLAAVVEASPACHGGDTGANAILGSLLLLRSSASVNVSDCIKTNRCVLLCQQYLSALGPGLQQTVWTQLWSTGAELSTGNNLEIENNEIIFIIGNSFLK